MLDGAFFQKSKCEMMNPAMMANLLFNVDVVLVDTTKHAQGLLQVCVSTLTSQEHGELHIDHSLCLLWSLKMNENGWIIELWSARSYSLWFIKFVTLFSTLVDWQV